MTVCNLFVDKESMNVKSEPFECGIDEYESKLVNKTQVFMQTVIIAVSM